MKKNIAKTTRPVAIWLFICCILTLFMVALGGYTRLTDSGLSITEWKPVTGVMPPLSDSDWQVEMDKYRNSPEYKKVNKGFSVEEFKRIYRTEYLHRLLGRIIGLCFLIPLLWFAIRRKIDRRLTFKLLAVFALGGLQGFAGWYMVKSGLVDDPHVSHFRLAFHLILAMVIYAFMFAIALDNYYVRRSETDNKTDVMFTRKLCIGFMALIVLQSILGAFVAGLDAGFMYNTFPLMDGEIMPDIIWQFEPWYINFLENPAAVQFLHRLNAILLLVYGIYFWLKGINLQPDTGPFHIFIFTLIVQLLLGITTLIYGVPVLLGVLHQVMAFILLSATLTIYMRLR